MAFNWRAFGNSIAGVSFEENMISLPTIPTFSDSSNSGSELQSVPKPSLLRTFSMKGFGVALTAKYSLKPSFHSKAWSKSRAFSLIAFSS